MTPPIKPAEFLADVRKGVWKELDAPQVKIDAYRRNLQRAYLDLANTSNGSTPQPPAFASATSGDERPFYRAELRALNCVSRRCAREDDRPRNQGASEGVRDQIAKILDPKFAAGGSAAGTPRPVGLNQLDSFSIVPDTCWPDYVIRP